MLVHLLALPCIRSLDLSLCDLDPHDGYWICRAIEQHCPCAAAAVTPATATNKDENNHINNNGKNIRKTSSSSRTNHHLQRLSLAGNYRMSEAIPKLVRLAALRLIELDCSFCDVQGKRQHEVFNILATTPHCTLKSFIMRGTRVNDVTELVNCLRCNISLRQLILDHPREPFPISFSAMERVLEAVKLNYSICVLRLDTYRCEGILQDMEFWLELNRCGRQILLQENDQRTKSWSTVLGEAARNDDVNVLYWILKHGSVMFAC
jgi:hypothetical protein